MPQKPRQLLWARLGELISSIAMFSSGNREYHAALNLSLANANYLLNIVHLVQYSCKLFIISYYYYVCMYIRHKLKKNINFQ